MSGRPTLKVENALFVVTLNSQRTIIRNGSIVISGQQIERIGKADDLRALSADRVIDATGMVVTPGFCNCHIHISYPHAVRGIFPDKLEREDYVSNVFKLQSAMTDEEEYYTSLLAITELLKYGTTCLLDPGSTKFLDVCIEAYEKAGCRIIIGKQVLDKTTPIMLPVMTTDDAIELMEDTIKKYDHKLEGRVRAWAMPFSARFSSRELLDAAKQLADKYKTGLTLHQNFSPKVVEEYSQLYGRRPVEVLEEWNLLGPNVLLSHVTGLNQREVDCLAQTQTRAALCPGAAMKLGIGLGENGMLPEMLEKGVCVGLGTDAGNNSNLIETLRAMYLVAVIFKDARQSVRMVPAETALEMATIQGAIALGLEKDIGSIEVGKKADLVLFDTHRPEWRSLFSPVNNLVYSADGRSVHTVIVDGRVLIEKYQVLFIDELDLLSKVQAIGENLLDRTGVSFLSPWPVV